MIMKTRAHDDTGLEDLDLKPGDLRDASRVREIIAAVEQTRVAEAELRRAVHAAREAGDSWTVIGMALGVTRQAAQKRFAVVLGRA
jgi:hypothetical protein